MSQEVEFKFAVESERAFDALLRQLDLPAREFHPSVQQVNHFFDTPGRALRAGGLTLRLREEAGRHTLALKGEERRASADGTLTVRLEEEVRLPLEAALNVLQGTVSPRAALAKRLGEGAPALQALDAALAGAELHYVGRFDNRRTRLPPVSIDVGASGVTVVFELDRTTFPGGGVEHEIEVELRGAGDAARLHASLLELFERAGVRWSAARSKAQRFFDALPGR
jgi:inorganic triphosphatase YgiF